MSWDLRLSGGVRRAKKARRVRGSCIALPTAPQRFGLGYEVLVRACISCHLSTGHGHPENSRLPGASAGYIARQLAEFKSGVRKGAANMLTFTKAMSDEEMKTAAEYFASLPVKRWTRVVETETV